MTYNTTGRPVVSIYQRNGPWNSASFTLHTPEGIHRHVDPESIGRVITSYPCKPVLVCQEGVCGKAKAYFRSIISNMPMP